MLTMRCWARLSFAPATIFIAFVIFCVDLTLVIRLRMTLSDGTASAFALAEDRPELGQRRLQLRLQVLVEHALAPQVLEDPGVLALEERVERRLVGGQLGDRQPVEEALRPGVDDDDLLLDRQGHVLPLLQDLDQARAALE